MRGNAAGEKSASEMAAALAQLLHRKLGARGDGLEAKLRRAGRKLPRRIRRLALEIVAAEKLEAHPRLARQTDKAALARAFAAVAKHLDAIDLAERRRGLILGILGSVALALLTIFAALTAFLVWRGYL